MNRLTVSVIVPVAKGAPSWASCASALRALSPAPLELIVVLDGPGAEDALEFANGFSVVRLPRRSGPAAARNLGAAMPMSWSRPMPSRA
jgi:glycosyltransferase involved in cell wall biosynthesis